MSHRIDQLFKDKLGEYKLSPTDEAWSRVQAGLKKNRVAIVWRVAAAVVIAAVLIGWINLSNDSDVQPELAQKPMLETPEEIIPLSPDQPETKEKTHIARQTKPANPKNRSDEKPVSEELHAAPEAEPVMEAEAGQLQTIAEISPATEEVKTEKAMVIEFTLPSVVTSHVPLAAVDDEQKSGLKKLIDTARDVKNGDADVSGGLREMKNELLAFDFIRNKPRRN